MSIRTITIGVFVLACASGCSAIIDSDEFLGGSLQSGDAGHDGGTSSELDGAMPDAAGSDDAAQSEPACTTLADFEDGSLSGWTTSGTASPTVTTAARWLIDGSYSARLEGTYADLITWPATYPGDASESAGTYATADAIVERTFVVPQTRTRLSITARSTIGHVTDTSAMYDHNRITVWANGTRVVQWDSGYLFGGLSSAEHCDEPGAAPPVDQTLTYDLASHVGETVTIVARAHNGGWCAYLSLDSIELCDPP